MTRLSRRLTGSAVVCGQEEGLAPARAWLVHGCWVGRGDYSIADDGRIVNGRIVILPVVVPAEEGLAEEEPGENHIIARSTHHYSSAAVVRARRSCSVIYSLSSSLEHYSSAAGSSQTTRRRRERCCRRRPRFRHCVCQTRTVSLLRVSVITRTRHHRPHHRLCRCPHRRRPTTTMTTTSTAAG